MKIWFSSDHHIGHSNIIKYCSRPYSNIDEMNRDLLKKWNQVVQPEDLVYYLGDFSLSSWFVTVFLPKLNGHKKLLLMGNHDRVHPVHKSKAQKELEIYQRAGFQEILLETTLTLNVPEPTIFKLSHLPYSAPKGMKDKYEKFRPKDEGHWLLCGHVHEKWLKYGKQINVGVDVHNGYPISVDKIGEIMKQPDQIFKDKLSTPRN